MFYWHTNWHIACFNAGSMWGGNWYRRRNVKYLPDCCRNRFCYWKIRETTKRRRHKKNKSSDFRGLITLFWCYLLKCSSIRRLETLTAFSVLCRCHAFSIGDHLKPWDLSNAFISCAGMFSKINCTRFISTLTTNSPPLNLMFYASGTESTTPTKGGGLNVGP